MEEVFIMKELHKCNQEQCAEEEIIGIGKFIGTVQ